MGRQCAHSLLRVRGHPLILSIHFFLFPSIHPSIHPLLAPSVHLSIHPLLAPSIHLSIHPSLTPCNLPWLIASSIPPSLPPCPAGVVRTAVPNMDREVQPELRVVIQAKDMGGHAGGLSGSVTVTVTLSDVNDNPPRFPQSKCMAPGVVTEVVGVQGQGWGMGQIFGLWGGTWGQGLRCS